MATPDQGVTSSLMRVCDETDDGDSDYTDEDATDSEGSEDEYDDITGTASEHNQLRTRSCPSVYTDNDEITGRCCIGRRQQTTTAVNVALSESLLQDSVAKFCTYICTEPYRDGKAGTTIMVYLAGVLGIAQDGVSFERPKNYTSKLSAILHSARLCLLEATLPRFPHVSLGWGPRPSLGQDKVLNEMRENYLCLGSPAPASELLSLRAYDRVLARTDGPAFRVDWTDDGTSMQWETGSLTMKDFCALGHRALSMVQESIGVLWETFVRS
jgi:hypothetical protein